MIRLAFHVSKLLNVIFYLKINVQCIFQMRENTNTKLWQKYEKTEKIKNSIHHYINTSSLTERNVVNSRISCVNRDPVKLSIKITVDVRRSIPYVWREKCVRIVQRQRKKGRERGIFRLCEYLRAQWDPKSSAAPIIPLPHDRHGAVHPPRNKQ